MSKIKFCEDKTTWLALRLSHITGTDVGAILGESEFNSKEDVIASKARVVNKSDNNFLMQLGIQFEDTLAKFYPKWYQNGYYIKDNKYMATTDFVSPDEKILIEIKTTISRTRYDKLCAVPKYIERQIAHQYICSGCKFEEVYLLVYLLSKGGKKLESKYIKLNNLPKDYTGEDKILLEDFYNKHVIYK